MAYNLEAIIVKEEIFSSSPYNDTNLKFAELKNKFWMLPLEANNIAEIDKIVGSGSGRFDNKKYFYKSIYPETLNSSIENFCINLSKSSYVLFCYAEYFAGMGGQYGVVWKNGEIAVGPYFTRWQQEDAEFNVYTIEEMAINICISQIEHKAFNIDGFDRIGLDRFRSTTKWYNAINNEDTI